MTLRAILKGQFRRRFTYQELRRDADAMILAPPLPAGWRDVMAGAVGRNGVSNLDYWRRCFDEQLRVIAEAPTWAAQRVTLLKAVLREREWVGLYQVAKDCAHTDAWKHKVEGDVHFPEGADAHYPSLLRQRWLMAALTSACLLGSGPRWFAVADQKEAETRLFDLATEEMLHLDVGFWSMCFDLLGRGEDQQALALAEFREAHVDPLLREEQRQLDVLADQICHGAVDVAAARRALERDQSRRAEILALLRAAPHAGDPAAN